MIISERANGDNRTYLCEDCSLEHGGREVRFGATAYSVAVWRDSFGDFTPIVRCGLGHSKLLSPQTVRDNPVLEKLVENALYSMAQSDAEVRQALSEGHKSRLAETETAA